MANALLFFGVMLFLTGGACGYALAVAFHVFPPRPGSESSATTNDERKD